MVVESRPPERRRTAGGMRRNLVREDRCACSLALCSGFVVRSVASIRFGGETRLGGLRPPAAVGPRLRGRSLPPQRSMSTRFSCSLVRVGAPPERHAVLPLFFDQTTSTVSGS